MVEILYNLIESIMTNAKEIHHVDPIIFLAIHLLCTPIFYFSLYKTIRSMAKKIMKDTLMWSTVFLASFVAPYIYVILFGKNIPWWVYLIIAVIVAQSIYSMINRLGKNAKIMRSESNLFTGDK